MLYIYDMKPTITIEYCPKCNWLMRAAYMAQELLTTFNDDIYGVTLQPSETSGKYSIRIDEIVIFDRKEQGRFPEIKELKQLVRDVVNPEKSLGHSDKSNNA
jgi:selenoprotein W-related protein